MNHASKSVWRTVGKYLRVTVIVAECIAVAAVSADAAGIGRIYRAPLMLPQATITDTTLYDFPEIAV